MEAFDDPHVRWLQTVRDKAHENRQSICRRIVTTPAHTLEGVSAKLRNAVGADRSPLTDGQQYAVNDDLVRSALADLERLAGRA